MRKRHTYDRILRTMLSATWLVAGSLGARAELGITGTYLSVDAGVNFLQDLTFKPGGGKVEMDPGYRIDFAAGCDLNHWAGLEFETGFLYNSLKGDPDNAWLGQVPLLLNFVARYDKNTKWVPYIGAGAGGALTVASDDSGSDSDFVFAWQGMAGLKYRINDRMLVDVSYKYFGTTEQSYDIGGKFKLSDIHHHMIGLSFTWKF